MVSRKIVVYKCSETFIDGNYQEKEVGYHTDEGIESDFTSVYIPKTKKGEKAMDFIEIALIGISVSGVALSYWTVRLYEKRSQNF
jgi:hypothetical protein